MFFLLASKGGSVNVGIEINPKDFYRLSYCGLVFFRAPLGNACSLTLCSGGARLEVSPKLGIARVLA